MTLARVKSVAGVRIPDTRPLSIVSVGDPDPISAGTAGEAALWGGSIAVMGMAATPLGAHQAMRAFAGRTDRTGVPARNLRQGWHARFRGLIHVAQR